MTPVNDPPYFHFDSSLTLSLSVPRDSRTHIVHFVVGSEKVPLLPSSALIGDVDSTSASEVNVSINRRQPGDSLGINVSLAEELNITVVTGNDERGLTTNFRIYGEAAFLTYKRVCGILC